MRRTLQEEKLVTLLGIGDEAVRHVYVNNRPDNQLLRARLAAVA